MSVIHGVYSFRTPNQLPRKFFVVFLVIFTSKQHCNSASLRNCLLWFLTYTVCALTNDSGGKEPRIAQLTGLLSLWIPGYPHLPAVMAFWCFQTILNF